MKDGKTVSEIGKEKLAQNVVNDGENVQVVWLNSFTLGMKRKTSVTMLRFFYGFTFVFLH